MGNSSAGSRYTKTFPRDHECGTVDTCATLWPEVSVRHQPGIAPARSRHTALVGRAAECGRLVQFLADLRAGSGDALVLLGEPGIGKSALLDYLRERASDVVVLHITGVQAEQELAFAGLYQLLGSLADRADALAEPQRAALRVAFGLEAGEPPGGFVVALATLALLEVLSAERPVLCVVDDQQWLDRASMQALTFAGRRLSRRRVGLVFATRMAAPELEALPVLPVGGLSAQHARELLDSALTGPLDPTVRRQIVAEAGGNPLALLELPRAVPTDLAGGYALPARCHCRSASRLSTGRGWNGCRLSPGGWFSSLRPTRWVIRVGCGLRLRRSDWTVRASSPPLKTA
jgi:hypothetical protein